MNHLQDIHFAYFTSPETSLRVKQHFSIVSKIPLRIFLQSDDIKAEDAMDKSLRYSTIYERSINKYVYDSNSYKDQLPSSFMEAISRTPKMSSNLPVAVVEAWRNNLTANSVGLSLSQNAIHNGCLASIIDVCILFLYAYIYIYIISE